MLETGSPFEQFVNLNDLDVLDPPGHDDYPIHFAERHTIAGRQLTIWYGADSDRCSNLHENLIDVEGSAGTASLLSLTIPPESGYAPDAFLTQLMMSESSRMPSLPARFFELSYLSIGGRDSVDIALLPTLRKYCPNLETLSLDGSGWAAIPPALLEPGRLRHINLSGGHLHWLYDLWKYDSVDLDCKDLGTQDQIEKTLLATAGSQQRQTSRIEHLKLCAWSIPGPWPLDAARFIAWQTKPFARLKVESPFHPIDYKEEERFDASLKSWKDEFNKRDDRYHNRGGRPLGFHRVE